MSGIADIERYELVEIESGLPRETRVGRGGRVNLPDQGTPRTKVRLTPAGRWRIEERPAGMAVASGVWAWT